MTEPAAFSVSGALRRTRRMADMSQREMAAAAGIARSTLAAAEAGARDLPAGSLARAAAVAGLRLVLLDVDGSEVVPMREDAVRDMGSRRFPAHLDTRHSEEGWWHGPERYSRPEPWYTFDRLRETRDHYRALGGVPDDHQLPQPGDAPGERRAARNRAALRTASEERERRRGPACCPRTRDGSATARPAARSWRTGRDLPGTPTTVGAVAIHVDRMLARVHALGVPSTRARC